MMAWLIWRDRKNPTTGRKATYYGISWREGSKVRTRVLGYMTKKEAERAKTIFEGKLAAGERVEPQSSESSSSGAVVRRPSEMPTLTEFMDEVFLPIVKRDKSERTYASAMYSSMVLKGVMGEIHLDKIDYAMVDDYLTARADAGKRSRTRQIEVRTLKTALKHAVKRGVIADVPRLPTVKLTDAKKRRFLAEDDSVALLDAVRPLDKQPHKVTRGRPPARRDRLSYLAILMALNTGMRKTEILTRTWDDIRWRQGPHGAIWVGAKPEVGFEVKMRRSRTIPLTPDLRAELKAEHLRVGNPIRGWIYPSPNNPKAPRQSFQTSLTAACKRAGLKEVVSHHDLRRTWASRLAMAGVDRRTLMEVGGWRDGRVLDEIYSQVTPKHVDEIMAGAGIRASTEPPSGSPHAPPVAHPRTAPERTGDRADLLNKPAEQLRVVDGRKRRSSG